MIKVQIFMKSGLQVTYEELNKIMIEDSLLSLSTFRGQYVCVRLDDIAGLEIKYSQGKASKAYAMYKQLIEQMRGGSNEMCSKENCN